MMRPEQQQQQQQQRTLLALLEPVQSAGIKCTQRAVLENARAVI